MFGRDPDVIAWWFTEVECASAIARSEREGRLTGVALRRAFARLDGLRDSWTEIEATPALRRHARRLVRVHRLRAADAGQLAAALVASEGHTEAIEFVSLDNDLNTAALREGFALPQLSL